MSIEQRLKAAAQEVSRHPEEAIKLAQTGLLETPDDNPLRQHWLVIMGNAYLRLSDNALAIEWYNKALRNIHPSRDTQLLCSVLTGLGNALLFSHPEQAIGYYEQTLCFLEDEKHLKNRSNILLNMAVSYKQMGNIEKALYLYLDCIKMKQQIADSNGLQRAYNNLGSLYNSLNKPDIALDYFKKAREITPRDSSWDDVNLMYNIGNSYLLQNKFAEARSVLLTALSVAEEKKYFLIQRNCYRLLAQCSFAENNIDEAMMFHHTQSSLSEKLYFENSETLKTISETLNVLVQRANSQNYDLLNEELVHATGLHCIGASPAMIDVVRRALIAASHPDVNVLITGESGTGKEIIARIIHFAQERPRGNFIASNAGAIPASLVESEFFGHVKGAFTGATSDRAGLFELAHQGTLFLDEIAEMPYELQSRLLRILEEKRVRRVGGNQAKSFSFRMIAATNQNIDELIAKKQFRLDLLHRLNTIEIHIPPLRDRREDIEPLVKFFVQQFADRMNISKPKVTHTSLAGFHGYSFPGNVRELRNLVERAMIFSEGTMLRFTVGKSSAKSVTHSKSSNSFNLLEQEKKTIARALEQTKGNKTQAAALLGISRMTLLRKLKMYQKEL